MAIRAVVVLLQLYVDNKIQDADRFLNRAIHFRFRFCAGPLSEHREFLHP